MSFSRVRGVFTSSEPGPPRREGEREDACVASLARSCPSSPCLSALLLRLREALPVTVPVCLLPDFFHKSEKETSTFLSLSFSVTCGQPGPKGSGQSAFPKAGPMENTRMMRSYHYVRERALCETLGSPGLAKATQVPFLQDLSEPSVSN